MTAAPFDVSNRSTGWRLRLRPQPTHQILDDRVLARETPATQLLVNPQRRHGRPAGQEILNEGNVLVQDAAPRLRRRRQIGMRRPCSPSRLVIHDDPLHQVARDPQLRGNPPHGRLLLPTPDHFVLHGWIVHGRSISVNRSSVNSATVRASRDQPLEARRQHAPVARCQVRPAPVPQPVLHPPQSAQQAAQLPQHPVPRGAQPRVPRR